MRTITLVIQFPEDRITVDLRKAVAAMQPGAVLATIQEGNSPAQVRAIRAAVEGVRALNCPMEESPEAALLDIIEAPIWCPHEPRKTEASTRKGGE